MSKQIYPATVTAYAPSDSTQDADLYTVTLADDRVVEVNRDREDTWYHDPETGDTYDIDLLSDADLANIDDAVSRFDDRLRTEYRRARIWELHDIANAAALEASLDEEELG